MAEPPSRRLTSDRGRLRGDLLKQFEVLVSVGSPGLYRVLSFFMVQHVYSLEDLGVTGSSMSVAQMAGFFTAIGWATLMLVRLPTFGDGRAAVNAFYSLISMAFVTTLVLSVCSVVVALSGIVRFDLQAFLLLLWGWSAYQLARHYFVAHKRYRLTIVFDTILIVSSATSLVLCKWYGLSSSCGLAFALILVAAIMYMRIGSPSRDVKLGVFEVEGLQFGLTNFLSGGVSLAMSPAAALMCGASFAGIFSLLGSATAVGALLPRAISLLKLPELAIRKSRGLPLADVLNTMRRTVALSNGAVLVLNIVMVVALATWKTSTNIERTIVIMTGLLLAIQSAIGMMGVTNSSLMMIFERGGAAAKINIVTTTIFGILFFIFAWLGGRDGFILILVSSIAIVAFRNRLIRLRAADIRRQYDDQRNKNNQDEGSPFLDLGRYGK